MDPVHFTAARTVASRTTPASNDVDAFYDDHACAGLHALGQAGKGVFRALRTAIDRMRRPAPAAPEFARTARSA